MSNLTRYKIIDLISDTPNFPKTGKPPFQDPNLLNPWGILIDNENIWVADNGARVLTRYDLDSKKLVNLPNIVDLPVTPSGPSPTFVDTQFFIGFMGTRLARFNNETLYHVLTHELRLGPLVNMTDFLWTVPRSPTIPNTPPNSQAQQWDFFGVSLYPSQFQTVFGNSSHPFDTNTAYGFANVAASTGIIPTNASAISLLEATLSSLRSPLFVPSSPTLDPPPLFNILPTGLIINKTQGFVIQNIGAGTKGASHFIYCSQDGTIGGYNIIVNQLQGTVVINNIAITPTYTGLVIGNNNLYVCNFANNRVDVFDYAFSPLDIRFIDGDTNNPLPSNYSPFNIIFINNLLYVLYAQQGTVSPETGITSDQPGPGNGYVSIFKPDGTFVKRLISRGYLNAPWAMIAAPPEFGEFEGKLLIGNHGDGQINVYDFDGQHLATLKDKDDNKIVIDGLWGLVGHHHNVFFTSGPNQGINGLLGFITPICHCEK